MFVVSRCGSPTLALNERTLDEYKTAVQNSDAEAEVVTGNKLKSDIVDLQRLHDKYQALLKIEPDRARSLGIDVHDESLELARQLAAQTLDD
ncbi:hypothetical protein BGW39_011582 [Mortierella sp. 14UC]|nr:hypothetical protein BGW39_011582 [Mortierella sp. 14UC]